MLTLTEWVIYAEQLQIQLTKEKIKLLSLWGRKGEK